MARHIWAGSKQGGGVFESDHFPASVHAAEFESELDSNRRGGLFESNHFPASVHGGEFESKVDAARLKTNMSLKAMKAQKSWPGTFAKINFGVSTLRLHGGNTLVYAYAFKFSSSCKAAWLVEMKKTDHPHKVHKRKGRVVVHLLSLQKNLPVLFNGSFGKKICCNKSTYTLWQDDDTSGKCHTLHVWKTQNSSKKPSYTPQWLYWARRGSSHWKHEYKLQIS